MAARRAAKPADRHVRIGNQLLMLKSSLQTSVKTLQDLAVVVAFSSPGVTGAAAVDLRDVLSLHCEYLLHFNLVSALARDHLPEEKPCRTAKKPWRKKPA